MAGGSTDIPRRDFAVRVDPLVGCEDGEVLTTFARFIAAVQRQRLTYAEAMEAAKDLHEEFGVPTRVVLVEPDREWPYGRFP